MTCHVCAAVRVDDPQHRYTCDWNLYPDQRPDPELCNLDCLDDPQAVAASRAYVDGIGLCFVLTEDNGSFCGRKLPCPEHSDGTGSAYQN